MNDIVERLRTPPVAGHFALREEAAAEIERLRAELETAKKLLDEDADEIGRLRIEIDACHEGLATSDLEIERLRTALANATRTVGDAKTAAGG